MPQGFLSGFEPISVRNSSSFNHNQWNQILFPDCIISITQLSHNPNDLTIFIEKTQNIWFISEFTKKKQLKWFCIETQIIELWFYDPCWVLFHFFLPLIDSSFHCFSNHKIFHEKPHQIFCDTHQQNAHFNTFKKISVKNALWI
jgi:hypothetical protein